MEILRSETGYPILVLDGFDDEDVLEQLIPKMGQSEGKEIVGFWMCFYGFKFRVAFEKLMYDLGFEEHRECPLRKTMIGMTLALPLWHKKDQPLNPSIEGMKQK